MSVKDNFALREQPEQIKSTVDAALRYYEMPQNVSLSVLEDWINETNTPVMFITRVFQQARLESEIEAEKLLDILTRLWNVTPRRELGGLSPLERMNTEGLIGGK